MGPRAVRQRVPQFAASSRRIVCFRQVIRRARPSPLGRPFVHSPPGNPAARPAANADPTLLQQCRQERAGARPARPAGTRTPPLDSAQCVHHGRPSSAASWTAARTCSPGTVYGACGVVPTVSSASSSTAATAARNSAGVRGGWSASDSNSMKHTFPQWQLLAAPASSGSAAKCPPTHVTPNRRDACAPLRTASDSRATWSGCARNLHQLRQPLPQARTAQSGPRSSSAPGACDS
jgi:hypothetical protein